MEKLNQYAPVFAKLLFVFGASGLFAQAPDPNPLVFSGYAEVYWAYDFGKPDNHERPGFFYAYNRHNEVNLNLAYLKAAYARDRVRGNLALMAGTYAQANLSAEQPVLRHVLEANVGVKIAKNANWWLDAGILPSHIGFESAIGKDCRALTRSLAAENSPYYESGVKVGFASADEKWSVAGLLLNGWQRIRRPEGNNTPAFGTQLTFKPNDQTTLNWSTFTGNDQPDTARQWRVFNNVYGIFQVAERVELTAGFDLGAEQARTGGSDYNWWYTPVLIGRFRLRDDLFLALRAEYYADPNGVIISTGTENGFKTFGFSANLDWAPADNVVLRAEARTLNSGDDVFLKNNRPDNSNFFVTAAAAIAF
jgi:Putative beta-barrel porin-2, OmpL-like. bbp2